MEQTVHPVLRAAAQIEAACKDVADAEPAFMSTTETAQALLALHRAGSRLSELRLRLLAGADDVAAGTGARDAAAWLADAVRDRPADCRAELRLARALDRHYPLVRTALREGEANPAQAAAMVRVLDDLPTELGRRAVADAEAYLVGLCSRFDPRALTRLGRHLLDVLAPEVADAVEAHRLEAEESAAREATRLALHRQGDGTTRITGRVPDATASRLLTYLHVFTSPRGTPATTAGSTRSDRHPRRLGEAFCRLLESLDPGRLPVHGGDATTVVVTVDLDALRSGVGAGTLLDAGLAGPDAPDRISAREIRRLACMASVLPVVLGGTGEMLDLGRARRLFSRAQRRALLLRDRTCRAIGCDVPGTWAEAHHWAPWHAGGATDLANGVLLCARHHHRAHDACYRADRLPDGGVRFTRRT